MQLEIWTVDLLPFSLYLGVLTHKQLQKNGCVLITAASDAWVQKHQAISTHNADKICIILDY